MSATSDCCSDDTAATGSKKIRHNEKLEPTGITKDSILNILNKKPKIGDFPKTSDTLAKVKSFLPQLKKADQELQKQVEEGQNVNIEDVDEDHDKYVEMNVGVLQQQHNPDQEWSEDSEPDSPPSPAERDNAFTSDSDSSSSDSVSSSSSSKSMELKMPQAASGGKQPPGTRPSIQELN